MARPRIAAQERRSETLAIRLSPAELVRIQHAAHETGLSASAYARELLLAGRVVVRQNRTLDHAVFDELRRVGVNLNQLTRLAHIKGRIPHELAAVCASLDRLLIEALDGDSGTAGNGELTAETAPDAEQNRGDGPGGREAR